MLGVAWDEPCAAACLCLMPDAMPVLPSLPPADRIADPCHAMHLPGSPRAAMVAEPFTPPAAVAAVAADAEQRVTVTRVPQDALESFDSAAL